MACRRDGVKKNNTPTPKTIHTALLSPSIVSFCFLPLSFLSAFSLYRFFFAFSLYSFFFAFSLYSFFLIGRFLLSVRSDAVLAECKYI